MQAFAGAVARAEARGHRDQLVLMRAATAAPEAYREVLESLEKSHG